MNETCFLMGHTKFLDSSPHPHELEWLIKTPPNLVKIFVHISGIFSLSRPFVQHSNILLAHICICDSYCTECSRLLFLPLLRVVFSDHNNRLHTEAYIPWPTSTTRWWSHYIILPCQWLLSSVHGHRWQRWRKQKWGEIDRIVFFPETLALNLFCN